MKASLLPLQADLLPAFRPYLLPQAAQLIEDSEEGLFALGAVRDAHSCGAVAGVREGNTLTIFNLYVDPQVRRQGIATQLYSALLTQVESERIKAVWILPEEEYLAMDAFLQAQGFTAAQRGDTVSRLTSAALREVSVLRRAFSPTFRPDANIVPVRDFTDAEWRDLLVDPNIPTYLRLTQFSDELLQDPLCLGYRYNGNITAYFICTCASPGEVVLRAAVSRKGASPAAFLLLTAAAIHQVVTDFGEPFDCWLSAVTPQAATLTDRLSGGRFTLWFEGKASCQRNLHPEIALTSQF